MATTTPISCSLCPVKFSRMTHLSRHMRSHTNQKPYQCQVCHAGFTRNDLLTRHKRTCTGSSKSRRKSCQACAESKIKCNKEKPCSKCIARGKECIFLNDPIEKRSTTQQGSLDATSTAPEDLDSLHLAVDQSAILDRQLDPLFENNLFDFTVPDFFDATAAPIWDPNPLSTFDSLVPLLDEPTNADLQRYLHSFFAFLQHVPMINPYAWDFENQPTVVTDVMCACGALLLQQDDPKASRFIDKTLTNARATIATEFAKGMSTSDESTTTPLIFAIVLLQHLGFFSHEAHQRESAILYHGMLVMMIRRSGLLSKLSFWVPPVPSDPTDLEACWKEWVTLEMLKRALFGAFVQDCCQAIYVSLPPIFRFDEFNFALPSDDALWKAKSAEEWYLLLQQPSIYGPASERMSGINFQTALASVTEFQSQNTSLTLNPGSYFILIHALLRGLYVSSLDSTYTSFSTQFALYNWMRRWLDNEECMSLEKHSDEPPMWCNVLPFYWLAQVTLFAIQQGIPIAGAKFFAQGSDMDQLSEMKVWMHRIRSNLRQGGNIPVDLMHVRPKLVR